MIVSKITFIGMTILVGLVKIMISSITAATTSTTIVNSQIIMELV